MNIIDNLSVIIITCNGSNTIAKVLQSVRFAGEIIILDSGSADNTIDICKKYTDKIVKTADWPGYGIQKNRALSYATKEWVLSIDDDEVLTFALQQEIIANICHDSVVDAFFIPMRTYFCGKLLRYGISKKDGGIRLFKRKKAKFTDSIVHEKIELQNSSYVKKLNFYIHHYSYLDVNQLLTKINKYSALTAQQQNDTNKYYFVQAIIHGLWTFFRFYILRLGFLDGTHGFLASFSRAECSYYKYIRLFLMKVN